MYHTARKLEGGGFCRKVKLRISAQLFLTSVFTSSEKNITVRSPETCQLETLEFVDLMYFRRSQRIVTRVEWQRGVLEGDFLPANNRDSIHAGFSFGGFVSLNNRDRGWQLTLANPVEFFTLTPLGRLHQHPPFSFEEIQERDPVTSLMSDVWKVRQTQFDRLEENVFSKFAFSEFAKREARGRVRSMRMGLFYRGPSVEKDLGIYRGVAEPYQRLLYQNWQLTKFFWHLFNLFLPFLPGLSTPSWHLFNLLLPFLPGLSTPECQPRKKRKE